MRLRIGTRGSALARAQAANVARLLEAQGHETETIIITTVGDRVTDRGFAAVGAFGIFVREIEAALHDGRIDVAVHSYKDMPSRGPDDLVVAAVPERVDAADVLLIRPESVSYSKPLIPLRAGARVGTSAARRGALVAALRPDVKTQELRGNVPTRVRALADGRYDAVILAAAGLDRLAREEDPASPLVPRDIVRIRLDPSVFVPAPAQGAIAVQTRVDARDVRAAVSAIDDPASARTLRAERAALFLADGGCALPFGAWCSANTDGQLRLVAVLGTGDGSLARVDLFGDDPDELAATAWSELDKIASQCDVAAAH
ncbi:MAG: hydroxymethylbilane synthase [Gemmatimonadaceae bacterium]